MEGAVTLLDPYQMRLATKHSKLCLFDCIASVGEWLLNYFLLIGSVNVYLKCLFEGRGSDVQREDYSIERFYFFESVGFGDSLLF